MNEAEKLHEEYLKADIYSKKREVENLQKSIKDHETLLGQLEEAAGMFLESIKKYTSPDMVRKLEPSFAFELHDGYWELQSRLIAFEQRRKYNMMVDIDIPNLKKTINSKKKGLEELQEIIKKMEGEMK